MPISIMQWNCRGVISKWPEIKPVLLDKGCDVICLQETHFLPTDQYDFNLNNYTVYNHFHPELRRQGGVCIYSSNAIPHFQLNINSPLQAVACSVRVGTTRLSICCLYLPPNERLLLHELLDLLSQLPPPFIICTDANSRHFLWGADRCDSRGNIWEQVIRSESLHVLNDGCPTRLDDFSGLWSHIDITLSSCDIGQYLEWQTDDDLHSSDHCPIYVMCDINRNMPTIRDTSFRWNLDKAKWVDFIDECRIHFDDAAGDMNCMNMTKCIIDAAQKTVPQKSGRGKYNCPWWTEECKEAIRTRKRALNRFRRSHSNIQLLEYKQAKAKARQIIRKAKKESWYRLLHMFNHTTPIRELWDVIKRFTKKERFHRPLPVLKVGGNIVDDPSEVANVLGKYYSELSSLQHYGSFFRHRLKEMSEHMPNFSSNNAEVYNADFTITELQRAVSQCGNTSVGPDMVHYAFFKHMNEFQQLEVLKLMNYIWDTGNYPKEWRHSIILPIKKPGKTGESPDAYRPIQLTSCFSKLMERMVAKRLAWYIDQNDLISVYQSAFKKKTQYF